MTQEEFNVVFELQMRKCADILAYKKKEYTGDNIDRLSAFKIAATLQNCDPKATLGVPVELFTVPVLSEPREYEAAEYWRYELGAELD